MENLEAFSVRDNVKLLVGKFDGAVLDVANRLYMVQNGSRIFSVDLNRDADRGHDAFISKTGEAYELDMLTLFVPIDGVKYGEVWSLYRDWILESVSESDIQDRVVEFDDGQYG